MQFTTFASFSSWHSCSCGTEPKSTISMWKSGIKFFNKRESVLSWDNFVMINVITKELQVRVNKIYLKKILLYYIKRPPKFQLLKRVKIYSNRLFGKIFLLTKSSTNSMILSKLMTTFLQKLMNMNLRWTKL